MTVLVQHVVIYTRDGHELINELKFIAAVCAHPTALPQPSTKLSELRGEKQGEGRERDH